MREVPAFLIPFEQSDCRSDPRLHAPNAGDAVITPVQNMGHGGHEMEKLRGACLHPPTALSSVPSTDVYQIPCESRRSGHSLELEKRGAK
jgi:hypothetical protein